MQTPSPTHWRRVGSWVWVGDEPDPVQVVGVVEVGPCDYRYMVQTGAGHRSIAEQDIKAEQVELDD